MNDFIRFFIYIIWLWKAKASAREHGRFQNIYQKGVETGMGIGREGRLILISAGEKLIDVFFHRVSLWFYKALDGSVYGVVLFESR